MVKAFSEGGEVPRLLYFLFQMVKGWISVKKQENK